MSMRVTNLADVSREADRCTGRGEIHTDKELETFTAGVAEQ